MKRIRVVHFVNRLPLSGTAKTAEIFCRLLPRDRFEIFAAGMRYSPPAGQRIKTALLAALGVERYRSKQTEWGAANGLIPVLKETVGADHLIVTDDWPDMKRRLLELKPDILHIHYSGNPEPPTSDQEIMSAIPLVVTTNVFANENTSEAHKKVARMIFISHHLLEMAAWAARDPRSRVLYFPIEEPVDSGDLRAELGIPADAFVLGRVGRPASSIHHGISLRAYQQIEGPDTWFVALAAPLTMIQEARQLELKNFIALPPISDTARLSQYYNTIDVLAHARRDGETFGSNIAEAMIHGKPVVSHRAPLANAQEEVIGDGGFVVDYEDDAAYAAHLRRLHDDPVFRREVGEKARRRALENFEAGAVTRRLAEIYEELLAAK